MGHGSPERGPWGTGHVGSPAQGGPAAPGWTPLVLGRTPAQGGPAAPGWTPLVLERTPSQRPKRGPVLVLVLVVCAVCTAIGVLDYLHSPATDNGDAEKLTSGSDSPTWQIEGDVIDAHAPLNPSSDWLRGQEVAWRIPAPEGELEVNNGSEFGRSSLLITSHYRREGDLRVLIQGWDVSGEEPQRLWRTDAPLSKVSLAQTSAFWVGETLISGETIVNGRTGEIASPSWLKMTDDLAVAGDTIIACRRATPSVPAKCTGHGFNGKLRWEAEPPGGSFDGFEHIADPAALQSLGYKASSSDGGNYGRALYAIDVKTGAFTKLRDYSAEQCKVRTLIDGWAFACSDDGALSLYDHTGALADTIVLTEPPLRLSQGGLGRKPGLCYTDTEPFWNHEPTMDELRAYYRDGDDSGTAGSLTYSEDCRSFSYREPGSGGAVHSFDSYGMTYYWVREYPEQPGAIRLPARVSEDRKILVLRGYLYFDVDGGEFLADTSLIKDELGRGVVAPEPNLIVGNEEGDVLGYRPSK